MEIKNNFNVRLEKAQQGSGISKNEHIKAMIDVATCYLFGFGVERNINEAIEWYKKAAQSDSPVAYHNLGFICYENGELFDIALNCFRKATDLGYADSAYMLGIMYLQGCGVEKNPENALEYFKMSFDLGKYYLCRPLGDLYFQGAFDNGKQNIEKALEWYMRGHENDVLSCVEALGDCYYYGFGVEIDFYLAYDFYSIAATKGSGNAAFVLGAMFVQGEGVKKNYREAIKWMRIAQEKGHPKASGFVELLTDIVGADSAAVGSVVEGGSSNIDLRSSYSASVEAVNAEQRVLKEQDKKTNAGIYAAAGAMSGNGSYTDYEMGAVVSPDGEVSYVDTSMGIILKSDGSVSSYDANSGLTYDWSTGNIMSYDEKFNTTFDFKSGDISYNFNGYTIK